MRAHADVDVVGTYVRHVDGVGRALPYLEPNLKKVLETARFESASDTQVCVPPTDRAELTRAMAGRNMSSMESPGVSQIMGFENSHTPRQHGPVVVGLDGVERPASSRHARPHLGAERLQVAHGAVPPERAGDMPVMQSKLRAPGPPEGRSHEFPPTFSKGRVDATATPAADHSTLDIHGRRPRPHSPGHSASPPRERPFSPPKLFDSKHNDARPPDSLRASLQGETTPRNERPPSPPRRPASPSALGPTLEGVMSPQSPAAAGKAAAQPLFPHKGAGTFRQTSTLAGASIAPWADTYDAETGTLIM